MDAQTYRIKLDELDKHIRGKYFIDVISCLSFDNVSKNPQYQRLTKDEWHLILGLWYKNYSLPSSIRSEKDVEHEFHIINRLLEELHLAFLPSKEELLSGSFRRSPSFYQESLLYEGDYAYDFQYVRFAEYKYQDDRGWLLERKDIDTQKILSFYLDIRRTIIAQTNCFKKDKLSNIGLTNYLCINIPKLVDNDKAYIGLINAFSYNPPKNEKVSYNRLDQISPSMERPMLRINDEILYVPVHRLLAQSLYELPFFWISSDREYFKRQGKIHRGSAGEIITEKILCGIFNDEEVFHNIEILSGKNNVSEIDNLVIYEGTAIIIQVKSKRITLDSRQGNIKRIEDDYQKAIKEAFSQAKKCENAIVSRQCTFKPSKLTDLIKTINDIICICITLDPIPGKDNMTRMFSELQEERPIVMSVFELDIITHFLNKMEFIKYLKFRINSNNQIIGNNEADYLENYLFTPNLPQLLSEYNMIQAQPANHIDTIMNKKLLEKYIPDYKALLSIPPKNILE